MGKAAFVELLEASKNPSIKDAMDGLLKTTFYSIVHSAVNQDTLLGHRTAAGNPSAPPSKDYAMAHCVHTNCRLFKNLISCHVDLFKKDVVHIVEL